MNFRFTTLAFVAIAASVPAAAQPAPGHPPVEAFGTLPAMARPSISPDGKHVATVQPYNSRPIARIDQTHDPRIDHLKVRQPYGDWKEIESSPADADTGLGVAGLTADGKSFVLTYYDEKTSTEGMLMHGADDTTVRLDQSEAMEHALTRAGKKVTFITIPKETHYMETSDTRIRWLTELEKFLKENIDN